MTQAVISNGQPTRAALKRSSEDVFRGLWTSLFYSDRISGNMVMISSTTRKEGTSTLAAGLAIVGSVPAGIARVALVDFNLRNPNLHNLLGLSQTPGVCEVLAQGLDPASIAQRVSSGLDVYPAGKVTEQTLSHLKSDALGNFFSTLSGSYDYVIVDGGAVNQSPETQVLCSVVRNAVLVCKTEQTPREAVAQAKKRLDAGGGKVAGLVLNLRSYPIPKFLYQRV